MPLNLEAGLQKKPKMQSFVSFADEQPKISRNDARPLNPIMSSEYSTPKATKSPGKHMISTAIKSKTVLAQPNENKNKKSLSNFSDAVKKQKENSEIPVKHKTVVTKSKTSTVPEMIKKSSKKQDPVDYEKVIKKAVVIKEIQEKISKNKDQIIEVQKSS